MEKPHSGNNSPDGVVVQTYIKPQTRKAHDADVKFEEYHYYAQRTREEEKAFEPPKATWREIVLIKKSRPDATWEEPTAPISQELLNGLGSDNKIEITNKEWTDASRAFRTAPWGACFFLITTDVLGPYGIAFSMGTLGWEPGIGFYTLFGFLAGYSGYLIWRVFLGVDSHEFPARNYGDLGFRTWGVTVRHITNIMQALGLLLILGQVTMLYGENISAVSRFKLCYAVCPVLFVLAGFLLTQIRTLKAYGLVANFGVCSTMTVIFITMGVISHSPPNYAISVLGSAGGAVDPATITPDAAGNYPPIIHYNGLPPNGLIGSVNGILSGVLAYCGAQLFVEFLAEMRRPRDFLKVMWGAQFFIYTVYLVYGCFIYHYQGQYSFQPTYLGISNYAWQTVVNMISLIGGLVCAGLYGNIGIKVLYNNVFIDIFNAPPLTHTYGKIIYAVLVPVWWTISFVIAAAIPDYFGFISVIASSTLLNLTYTLPPFFALGFDIQRHAILTSDNSGFDPSTGNVKRHSSETTVRRWVRGFFSGGAFQVAINLWHLTYFLASLAMCGLGMYAAVEGMITAFEDPELNSFSCRSPLDLNT